MKLNRQWSIYLNNLQGQEKINNIDYKERGLEMRLSELVLAFEQGKIERRTFWTLAREKLVVLKECEELMSNNHACKSIEITKTGIILQKSGIRFYFDFSQIFCRAETNLVMEGAFEQEDFDFLKEIIHNNSVVFDLGANVGLFSLEMVNNNRTLDIYSFEPLPPTYAKLLRNLELNKLEKEHVSTFNIGMSKEKGEFIFYLPSADEAASMKPITDEFYMQEVNPQGLYSGEGQSRQIVCKVSTVDDFCQENGISRVDVLKLDIEGAEYDALQGARQTLLKCRPIVYCEMLRKHAARFGYHPNEIIEYMEEIGYKCFTFHEHQLVVFFKMTDETKETNFFFLHREKHQPIIKKYIIDVRL